jgi:hypothetical protein
VDEEPEHRGGVRKGKTNAMNDKHELLLTEAMDLINRAKSMIDLLPAEERRGEAWTLPLETAVKHLADARMELDALSVDDPKLSPQADDPPATVKRRA